MVGEAFNVGGPVYNEAELLAHIARRLRVPFHEIEAARPQPSWYLDTTKAARLLGWRPTRTVYDMVEEALA